ncbi:MAG: hypothetical protein GVY13_10335 [Alphaproteobacteria bacterium]|jgi:hypothetical protein|nr:hypothetical protein [Alphaproteobacteria bacterium]
MAQYEVTILTDTIDIDANADEDGEPATWIEALVDILGLWRVFEISSGADVVTFAGLIITGRATQDGSRGGGVSGDATLVDSIVLDNEAGRGRDVAQVA